MDGIIHIAVELAGTSVAGLHLVDHKGNIMLVGQLVRRHQILLGQGEHAALALDNLHQDTRHMELFHTFFQFLDVIGRHMDKAGGQGLEQLMKVLLSRSRQGCQGAAMEAVLERHDGVAVHAFFLGGILSRHFYGALVGLRAGVGEKYLLHAGFIAQELGKFRARLGVIQIGGVLHLAQLIGHRRHPLLVPKAESGDTDAGAHVHIALAVYVHHTAALAGNDLHREALVGARNVFLICFNNAHVNLP